MERMPEITNCRAGVALVIGVGAYLRAEQVETLRFAARDAVALADALSDPHLCSFPSDQVILLTDGEARRDEVVQRLSRWLPERARGAEVVVIYFAGHGMVHTVGRREEGFLLPHDADPDDVVTRGVAMSDVARWIDGLDARAVVVCLDCCHAGMVLGQRDPGSSARNLELRPAVLQGMAGRGRYLIASCDEGQKSFECAELGHGLFTYHLLQGIAGSADSDGDGRVGLAELFNYVSREVARDARQRFGREQKPWTRATWAEETYISSPTARTAAGSTVSDTGPLERLWREQGAAAAVREIERTLPDADEEGLRRSLHFLGRVKDPAGVPVIFRCLAHASEAVRGDARSALHAFDWAVVVGAVEGIARGGGPEAAFVLDGLNAFEAHPRVVDLLNRLVVLLKGDLRNRTILLWRRKQLALELDHVADLFREVRSPYQLQKVLGEGLFTASYLARDEGTGLEVVVRVLHPELACQPHVRAQFLDLARQSVHLIHEKLALTREVRSFPERNIYFAVRDYIPGVTLQRVLETGKQFTPAQIGRILRDVAEALTPLHRKTLCHGSIKPSNIFLCEEDRVVLGDPSPPVQGVGVALDRLAYDYRYAAPEMFRGAGAPGPAADFYALGCVAYELACGQPPFVSDNYHELVAYHLLGPVLTPSRRGSRLGAGGDEVLLRLLAESPAGRYGTLEEVLRALASLGAAPAEAAPGPAPPPPAPPLLREASLLNYQGPQSILNFNRTMDDSDDRPQPAAGPAPEAEKARALPQVPGYEVLGVIGRGAMGTVYRARQISLQRMVALKTVPLGGWADSSEHLTRFRREALLTAGLRHPNIVQVMDVLESEDHAILVLELVEGGTLDGKVRQGPLPARQAAGLVAALARAVHYAHEKGVLHRDLKPSNILLTPEGEPKITDFGLARRLDADMNMTAAGTVLGTPAYMAPEQALGAQDKVGPALDVYCLGGILYFLLTCRPPFQGGTLLEVLRRALEERPAPPRQLNSQTPKELEAICLKCLEKGPARRYPTAAALADDLERLLRGEPISLPLPSLWQRLARFFSSRKPNTPRGEGRAPDA
jgi:serine/threonine protein kinase